MATAQEVRYTVVDHNLATLSVVGGDDAFGLHRDGQTQIHPLGYRDAPLFLLEEPFSPDEAWAVSSMDSGQTVPAEPAVPQDLARWAPGGLSGSLAGVLGSLPVGQYRMVCNRRQWSAQAEVLLGNEMVRSSPDVGLLCGEAPVYSLVWTRAASSAEPPGVLLGVAVLNYTGRSTMDGLWLFDVAQPAEPAPQQSCVGGSEPGQVLIIPLSGTLVVDPMELYSDDEEKAESLTRWAERSEGFARWCAEE